MDPRNELLARLGLNAPVRTSDRDGNRFGYPGKHKMSRAEAFFFRALLRAKPWLPADLTIEYRVEEYKLDFAVPSLLVDVEIDGWQHRLEREASHDEQRTLRLEHLGWNVIRFPSKEVIDDIKYYLGDDKYYPGWKADNCVWALLKRLERNAPPSSVLGRPERIGPELMRNRPFTKEKFEPPFHADYWPGSNGWGKLPA
jgi:very-short-patch-repair endonuclease